MSFLEPTIPFTKKTLSWKAALISAALFYTVGNFIVGGVVGSGMSLVGVGLFLIGLLAYFRKEK